MFGFLTGRRSGEKNSPGWYDRHFSPVLLSIAKKACSHPIHTIVLIACAASYSYLGALNEGLLESSGIARAPGKVDFNTLLAGSKRLHVGEETGWKWELEQAPIEAREVRNTTFDLASTFLTQFAEHTGTCAGHSRIP